MIECLLNKHKTLSSNPSIARKEKKKLFSFMNSSKELFKNISLRKLCFEELTLGEYTKL
jgi:hypothetical protein